jgi:hypothetical protein
MASSSFFDRTRWAQSRFVQTRLLQTPEDALRHVDLLTKGLKKVAWAGMAGGAGCAVLALLVGQFLAPHTAPSNAIPGTRELSGVLLVDWFMAIALLVFSTLYLIAGWGLSHQKSWARYTAAAVFLSKVLLCVWLGRGSIGTMIVFLFVASWDLYGLWVLLSKQTGQLFAASQASPASGKPATRSIA